MEGYKIYQPTSILLRLPLQLNCQKILTIHCGLMRLVVFDILCDKIDFMSSHYRRNVPDTVAQTNIVTKEN